MLIVHSLSPPISTSIVPALSAYYFTIAYHWFTTYYVYKVLHQQMPNPGLVGYNHQN